MTHSLKPPGFQPLNLESEEKPGFKPLLSERNLYRYIKEEQLREAVEKLSSLQDENEDLKKRVASSDKEDPRVASLTRWGCTG